MSPEVKLSCFLIIVLLVAGLIRLRAMTNSSRSRDRTNCSPAHSSSSQQPLKTNRLQWEETSFIGYNKLLLRQSGQHLCNYFFLTEIIVLKRSKLPAKKVVGMTQLISCRISGCGCSSSEISATFFTFYLLFLKTFYNCIVPKGFLPWEIRVAFPRESQLQQSHTTQPRVLAGCFSVSIVHQTLTWSTGSLTCTQM